MENAQQILQNEDELSSTDLADAQQFYIDNAGQMERGGDSNWSRKILKRLAETFVSPVQSARSGGVTYYGVIDYHEEDEWYGFQANDERSSTRRVVGVREVPDATEDADLPHVTAGDPSGSFADQPDAAYADLAGRLTEHYDGKYGEDRGPPEVAVGAPETPPGHGKRPDHAGGPQN